MKLSSRDVAMGAEREYSGRLSLPLLAGRRCAAWKISLCQAVRGFAAAGSLALFTATGFAQTAQPIPVVFTNATQGERPTNDIYINLVGGGVATNAADLSQFDPSQSIGTYTDGTGASHDLFTNTSYSLADITNQQGQAAISLLNWDSGRLYISYGSAMTGLGVDYTPTTGPYYGWQPPPSQPDVNFQIRHQAVELSVLPLVVNNAFTTTTQIFSDLSYIDYTAISLGMQVHNAPAGTTNPVQTSANTATMLAAVAGTNASAPMYTPNSNILTIGTVPNSNPAAPIVQVAGKSTDPNAPYQNAVNFPAPDGVLPSPNFLRVSGPGSMGTLGSSSGPTAYYPVWNNYLTALQSGGTLNPTGTLVTTIGGTYAASTPITYNMTATFNSGNVTVNGTNYTGYVSLAGTIEGVSGQSTIVIPYEILEENTGLYGANPSYEYNGTWVSAPGNDVATWIVGDLVAGMNFGFVGSPVTNPQGPGTIGAATSSDWWIIGALNDGQYQYTGLQPDNPFYNIYAAALKDVTSGYGFAYGDRIGTNTTQFSVEASDTPTTAYLEVLVQPDFAAVPEPSALALLIVGAFGALGIFGARRLFANRKSTPCVA